jgi:hypothetical protein
VSGGEDQSAMDPARHPERHHHVDRLGGHREPLGEDPDGVTLAGWRRAPRPARPATNP